jgi:hypothetical protein
MGKKAPATGIEAEGEKVLITIEEFDEFVVDMQRRLDSFAQGQQELANVQADTSVNLNKVQAETNSKLDKLREMITGLLVRHTTPPDFRDQLDSDRNSSVQGNFVAGSPAGNILTTALPGRTPVTLPDTSTPATAGNTQSFGMPVFTDATRTTIPLLVNLVPPLLERPAGPMLNLGNHAPRAPTTEPQTTTAVEYNQLIVPQQDNQYRGANGPGHRQRQLHFDDPEAHCCNRGNCNGRRYRENNGEGQNPMTRHFAKGPKMEFPEFMGDQVEGWIKKANKYFKLA